MNKMRTKTKQAGSVILEALISILIFSIGILALIGMQAAAINNVADAKYRSTAGFLANQMVGTIWATRLNANPLIPNASNAMAASPDLSFACDPCTSASSVGNAYTQAWMENSVTAGLPNGRASIAINGTGVTVTIAWQPPKDAVVHRHVASTFIN